MRIHYLQHVPFEGLGSIERWIVSKGYPVSRTLLYDREPFPDLDDLDFLMVMGGPMGAMDEDKLSWLKEEKRFIEKAIRNDKTVLGVCLGAQLIANVLGAKVFANENKEIGWFPVRLTEEGGTSPLFRGFNKSFSAFHWHGDTFDLPCGASLLAKSHVCENQAFIYDKKVVGFQFHLDFTRQSVKLLIQNCRGDLTQAPCVQPPENILSDPERFDSINQKMEMILDRLVPLT